MFLGMMLDATVLQSNAFFPPLSSTPMVFVFFFYFLVSKLENTFQNNNRETMQMIHTEIPKAKGHASNHFIITWNNL